MKIDAAQFELRLAEASHGDQLHELFCLPDVYRYLADGAPPAREITSRWIEKSREDREVTPEVGLFRLLGESGRLIGCVRTHFLNPPRTAELTYVLHPDFRGCGLATSMGWTAMRRAFDSGHVDTVIAGTDDPNTASVAVMRRLGMRFRRKIQNPRWPGVEYVLERLDPWPTPVPRLLPMRT
ncbi:MAG: GNAT family N-acetyltransferase [Pseudomonadales bacterium]